MIWLISNHINTNQIKIIVCNRIYRKVVKNLKEFKQNILYKLNGEKIKLQFDFCTKCKYFNGCYEGGFPHYLNQECIEDFLNGKENK